MGKRIRKLKKQRLHSEGNDTLLFSLFILIAISVLLWRCVDTKIPFWIFVSISGALYLVLLNFYRCPVRRLDVDDTENIVVAPADGKIVVVEEVDENRHFHDRRLMISIFMSPFNVHANWFPVDGRVTLVHHQNGNFHKAWLPKASEGIVTYAKPGEECEIDDHLGFIKLGSRVDVYLPVTSEVCVKMGQATTGDQTIIAKLR